MSKTDSKTYWTKYAGKWCIASDKRLTYGTDVDVAKRSGSVKTVVVRAHVGTVDGKYVYMVDSKTSHTYKAPKTSHDYTDCDCGATRHVKDHGTWIGYYCPACGSGGSSTKK